MAEGIGLLNQRIDLYTMGSNPISGILLLGWRSARWSHNPKVVSSILALSTTFFPCVRSGGFGLFLQPETPVWFGLSVSPSSHSIKP